MFYPGCFCKSIRDSWARPHQYFWQLTRLIYYKASKLGCIFHHWRRLHLTSGPVQTLKISKSSWLGREVTNIEVDWFHSRRQIKNISFHSSCLLWPSSFQFLYQEVLFDSLVHPLSCSSLKIMSLFTYLRPFQSTAGGGGWW